MDHEYYRDRVSAFHDLDMTPEEARMMQEHLESCDECRELLAEFERLDQLIETHSGLDDSEYWEQAARKIDREIAGDSETTEVTEVKRSGSGPWWKFAAVAASIAVLAYVGLNRDEIFKQQDTIKPPASELPRGVSKGQAGDSLAETLAVAEDGSKGLIASKTDEPADVKEAEESTSIQVQEKIQEASRKDESFPEVPAAETPAADRMDQAAEDGVAGSAVDAGDVAELASNRESLKTQDATGVTVDNAEPAKPESTGPGGVKRTAPALHMWSADDRRDSGKINLEKDVVDLDVGLGLQDSLRLWRERRDAFVAALKNASNSRPGQTYSATAKDSDSKSTATAEVDSMSRADSVRVARLNLLEAWFHIALITPDDDEFQQAVGHLDEAAAGSDDELRKRAGAYLKELERESNE